MSNIASRQLSLGHPAAQHRACAFYRDYGHLIPYFCRHEAVSLRRPVKIGSTYFYLGPSAERKQYKGAAIDMLLQDQTVRNPGSFFAYEGYDRFYKFFNSEEFVGLEKKFSLMRLTDISKCFSSIYSHTLAWAVKDVQHGKESTSAVSFANDFDSLMQYANYNETNGIPVGAELSRIFAEIILQSVEASVLRKLETHLVYGSDFVIRRYIDDYTIFANKHDVLDAVQRAIADALLLFNLHLNESKTFTKARPLQTRRSQIISGAAPAVQKFRDAVHEVDQSNHTFVPKRIRDPRALVRSFSNDVKVACTNGDAGYEDVSPFIIGSIASTIELLIASFNSAAPSTRLDEERYARAFDALLSSMFYFFIVHATVTSSYQVAKAAVLSIRFFRDNLPGAAEYINERARLLFEDVITNPNLSDGTPTDWVPIEMLNIILASTELPEHYRPNVFPISRRVLDDKSIDYFSIVAFLFYFGQSRADFAQQAESKLRGELLPKVAPLRNSRDAHLLLDLISCPHLTSGFRKECAEALFTGLGMSAHRLYSLLFVKEVERFPWFINWREIDLLNHLRKKELRTVY
ncbi:RNA-directed DNA polymerase [Bradyrhizobium sp. Mp27]|nr:MULTISPECIES: antiviral reverse transcriptase Drt3b [Bradyrhizobium]MDI2077879.1 RNA-directed DNA polymerase [Bradyrhizobium sp. Mp27]